MMRVSFTAAGAALFLAGSVLAQPVEMEWVTVGNPGNAADPTTGFGSVGYAYRIGRYEVTNAQYAAFLNSVAASDPNGLYNPNMGSDARGGITRSGSDGSYDYSVKANMGDKPVNYVSWYDATRMANWMTNGQPTGAQDATTTESGVYTLTGETSVSGITRDLNNPNQVFIPTENEWYKAAYHQPASEGGDADNYWLYATQSNSVPTIASATSTGDVANPGQDVVNYILGADWNGQNGNVTTVGSAGSTSFYGAFDMNGNVFEWNEMLIQTPFGSRRGIRAGSFGDADFMVSSSRGSDNPSNQTGSNGLRLASPVSPCSPADINMDGVLTGADFNAWLSAFSSMDPRADQNQDGVFTGADFNAFLTNFSAGCGPG